MTSYDFNILHLEKMCRKKIHRAIATNTNLTIGILCSKLVHIFIKQDKYHMITLISAPIIDESHVTWFGYICPSHQKKDTYISLIIGINKFINAKTIHDLVNKFYYYTDVEPEWEPVFICNEDEAYIESKSFIDAVDALSCMVSKFDIESQNEFSKPENFMYAKLETRSFDVFNSWLKKLKNNNRS